MGRLSNWSCRECCGCYLRALRCCVCAFFFCLRSFLVPPPLLVLLVAVHLGWLARHDPPGRKLLFRRLTRTHTSRSVGPPCHRLLGSRSPPPALADKGRILLDETFRPTADSGASKRARAEPAEGSHAGLLPQALTLTVTGRTTSSMHSAVPPTGRLLIGSLTIRELRRSLSGGREGHALASIRGAPALICLDWQGLVCFPGCAVFNPPFVCRPILGFPPPLHLGVDRHLNELPDAPVFRVFWASGGRILPGFVCPLFGGDARDFPLIRPYLNTGNSVRLLADLRM
nr:hypothetical protein Iba_chr10cCG5870 [Ipomoea batatas]